jgi:hypothetical protein
MSITTTPATATEAELTDESAEVLAARKAAAEYGAVVAELRRVADAIDAMPVGDLALPVVELKISTRLYERIPAVDAVKIATVDAVAMAVLGRAAQTEATSQDWMYHIAMEQRGPVNVKVWEIIADPKVRERESELERLRAEVAELRAAVHHDDLTPDEIRDGDDSAGIPMDPRPAAGRARRSCDCGATHSNRRPHDPHCGTVARV